MSKGDLLLVGGSFYDSSSDLQENGDSHISRQYGYWARSIALNSIGYLLDLHEDEVSDQSSSQATLNYSNIDKVKSVNVELLPADNLPHLIHSKIPMTKTACFWIQLDDDIRNRLIHNLAMNAQEVRELKSISKIYILSSKRYVVDDFCEFMEQNLDLSTPLVKDYDNLEEFPYYHLAFERL